MTELCAATARFHGGALDLTVTSGHPGAAPFSVLDGTSPSPVPLDVRGTRQLRLQVRHGGYQVTVLGPDRFRYDARGVAGGVSGGLTLRWLARDGGLIAVLRNDNLSPITVRVRCGDICTVALASGATREVPLSTVDDQYDVTVTIDESPAYHHQMTGQVGSRARD